jgi:hypothetical protein
MSSPRRRKLPNKPICPPREALQAQRDLLLRIVATGPGFDDAAIVLRELHCALYAPAPKTGPKAGYTKAIKNV